MLKISQLSSIAGATPKTHREKEDESNPIYIYTHLNVELKIRSQKLVLIDLKIVFEMTNCVFFQTSLHFHRSDRSDITTVKEKERK